MARETEFVQHSVPRNLGTRKIIDECQKLAGPDGLGRNQPAYAIVYMALTELRDRLRKAKGKKGGGGS